ncbi:transcriptional repressor [Variovorax sp. J2P1-59]|uniref:transcriptional repressor n=1 Tax=Variovorax flavidus TaxID=3053501 RepID=UPI0025757ABC|nr:transcriptional repressor [Variovorax sp. J2P1-59]MDM0075596.1 transcriptional repressor [Variovorax sp. J2P1-59]
MEQVDRLRHTGLKATLPRVKVLELFQQSEQRHLAAEEVYRQMVRLGMDVGRATVYRVLPQFERAGLLKKTRIDGARTVYELNDGKRHHGHLVSLVDGSVREFFDSQIEARLLAIAQEQGFDMADYGVTVFGRPR